MFRPIERRVLRARGLAAGVSVRSVRTDHDRASLGTSALHAGRGCLEFACPLRRCRKGPRHVIILGIILLFWASAPHLDPDDPRDHPARHRRDPGHPRRHGPRRRRPQVLVRRDSRHIFATGGEQQAVRLSRPLHAEKLRRTAVGPLEVAFIEPMRRAARPPRRHREPRRPSTFDSLAVFRCTTSRSSRRPVAATRAGTCMNDVAPLHLRSAALLGTLTSSTASFEWTCATGSFSRDHSLGHPIRLSDPHTTSAGARPMWRGGPIAAGSASGCRSSSTAIAASSTPTRT